MRERVRSGGWRTGEMIPSRRHLAREHGVALGTVERAVTTLISEGALRADDRWGTFVTGPGPEVASRSWGAGAGEPESASLVGTVGIVAPIVPYQSEDVYEGQWPVQVLHACEHRLAAEAGLTMHFLNLVEMGRPDLPFEAVARQLVEDRVDAAIFLHCEATYGFRTGE